MTDKSSEVPESEPEPEPEPEEALYIDRATAKATAEKFGKDGVDPNPSIPHSLLSAEHIRDYVKRTGLIGPYNNGTGAKTRLKKAAYEGRIGEHAYLFNKEGVLEECFLEGGLLVPANSIVFVECDLDFRLPEFIALRFNLQIRHVHRGLLLGTGPLVDPGYWGKLCIPLHNLTDEDYLIPLDEGLIWLEFTKTTSNLGVRDKAIGRAPLGKEFWDIQEFITKAQKPYSGIGRHPPIRSSMGAMVTNMFEEAKKKADTAISRVRLILGLGGVAVIGITIGVYQLWAAYVSMYDRQYEELRQPLIQLQNNVADINRQLQNSEDSATVQPEFSLLLKELQTMTTKIESLNQNSALLERILNLENELSIIRSELTPSSAEGTKLAE